jgi:glutathione S-transferase
MSTLSTLLPPDYGYVFGGLFMTVVSNFYLVINVALRRKKYGIKYPALYADASHISKDCKSENVEEFNCAQRAHQNTCEGIGTVQLLGSLNGLLFPRFSAACLGFYAIGRIVYGYGYVNNGPDGRMAGGIITHLGDFPIFICTAYSAAKLLGYA